MLRRRTMMADTKPTQDWDVVWDYTMGFPEENGFTLVTTLPTLQAEMTLEGVSYKPPINSNTPYFELSPTEYVLCEEAIFEVDASIQEFTDKPNGLRIMISDQSQGLQIYVYNGMLYFQNKTLHEPLSELQTDTIYTFRIERKGGINTVFLNGRLMYEGSAVSAKYNTKTRVIFQNGGIYLLKSIKFKKIS